jgi:hypothetical protein
MNVSTALEYMARLVADTDPDAVSTIVAWNKVVAEAQVSATIMIQSATRQTIARNTGRSVFDVTFGIHAFVHKRRV